MAGMDPKAVERVIDLVVAVVEILAAVVPDLLASKMAKSAKFRELVTRVTASQAELTETELEADRARARVGGG